MDRQNYKNEIIIENFYGKMVIGTDADESVSADVNVPLKTQSQIIDTLKRVLDTIACIEDDRYEIGADILMIQKSIIKTIRKIEQQTVYSNK